MRVVKREDAEEWPETDLKRYQGPKPPKQAQNTPSPGIQDVWCGCFTPRVCIGVRKGLGFWVQGSMCPNSIYALVLNHIGTLGCKVYRICAHGR